MRILFATYTLAAQNPGGGEKVIEQLKRGLEARGHEVGVFDPWDTRVSDWDLVHYFSMIESSQWVYLKGRNFERKLVVTPTFYRSPNSRGRVFARSAGRGRLDPGWRPSLPDFWIAATEKEKSSLSKHLGVPSSKIGVVPNGVASAFVGGDAEAFRKKYGIAGPFLLHVGRFHPVKNHLVLAEAARQAKATLVCIGEPEVDRSEYFERCTRVIVENGGRVIRGLNHENPLLAGAYAAAQAFALPSEFETFGLAALEASVAGAPLILSSELQAREVFPRATWVDPQDIDSWVIAIKKAMKTPRAPAVASEQKALSDKYSWATISEATERLYADVLRN